MSTSSADRVRRHRERQKFVEQGAKLGADEADRRIVRQREFPHLRIVENREERIARASEYARKWFDGEIGPT